MKRWYAALRSRRGALAGAAFTGALGTGVIAVVLWDEGTTTETTRAGVSVEHLDGRWATGAIAVGTGTVLLLLAAVHLVVSRYREVPAS